MMSVEEYAEDVNRTVDEILKKCEELGFSLTSSDDMLEQDEITELDSVLANDSMDELEDLAEDLASDVADLKKIDIDNTVKKQKLKKKSNIQPSNKKE